MKMGASLKTLVPGVPVSVSSTIESTSTGESTMVWPVGAMAY